MEINGINRKILILIAMMSFSLSGCTILPGMQNLNSSSIPKYRMKPTVITEPVIIPITPTLLATDPPPPYIYRIAPQDVLSIIVWQHPEFNPPIQQTSTVGSQSSQAAGVSGYLVNHAGSIFFPLVGNIEVAGKTVEQVRVELSHYLKTYVRNPQVMVRVADYRSKKVYVFGEVMRPGLLPLNDQPMTITDALTLTGSLDPNAADPRHIYIIRGDFIRPKIYWLEANSPEKLLLAEHFHLQPSDVIYVSSAIVTRWNRFLNQLLPTLQTIWYTKTITNK